ncbi:MAG: hemerythrin domain-containing protein [Proteobacteria bacterium]|nr:hemerythrin domain-containing protein [Pseudomonadota bacterium]
MISVIAEHERLREHFQHYRLALFSGEIRQARFLLDQFRTELMDHAQIEENLWLPRLKPDARWPARVYLAEHRKLEEMVGSLLGDLERLPDEMHDARQLLQLLEWGMAFKHVLEHHFEREEKALFQEVAD